MSVNAACEIKTEHFVPEKKGFYISFIIFFSVLPICIALQDVLKGLYAISFHR